MKSIFLLLLLTFLLLHPCWGYQELTPSVRVENDAYEAKIVQVREKDQKSPTVVDIVITNKTTKVKHVISVDDYHLYEIGEFFLYENRFFIFSTHQHGSHLQKIYLYELPSCQPVFCLHSPYIAVSPSKRFFVYSQFIPSHGSGWDLKYGYILFDCREQRKTRFINNKDSTFGWPFYPENLNRQTLEEKAYRDVGIASPLLWSPNEEQVCFVAREADNPEAYTYMNWEHEHPDENVTYTQYLVLIDLAQGADSLKITKTSVVKPRSDLPIVKLEWAESNQVKITYKEFSKPAQHLDILTPLP